MNVVVRAWLAASAVFLVLTAAAIFYGLGKAPNNGHGPGLGIVAIWFYMPIGLMPGLIERLGHAFGEWAATLCVLTLNAPIWGGCIVLVVRKFGSGERLVVRCAMTTAKLVVAMPLGSLVLMQLL